MSKAATLVQRRYDLDWLRVIAFGLLMLFHTGMMFTSFEWHVKNLESSRWIDATIDFLHEWRMPLLFFISGAAVWFAMEKYSTWVYVRERQTRLLWPLMFGMLVVIPPQVYCERVYQQQNYASFLEFYRTVWTSGTYPSGNLSWHHLWYIPYIWAFSMITLPVFMGLRTQRGRVWLDRIQRRFLSLRWLCLLFVPSAVVEIVLRPYFPGDSHDLVSDWANFGHKLSFFVAGFVLASAEGVADVLARHRCRFLVAAVAAAAMLEWVWSTQTRLPSWAYRSLSNFHIWAWLLAAMGWGRHSLNFNHRYLRYATEAVYPFYILHQTVIVVLGLPLAYVDLGIWTKFTMILVGMTVITWGLYALVIARFDSLRLCFGLKRKKRGTSAATPDDDAPRREGVGGRDHDWSAVKVKVLLLAAALGFFRVEADSGRLVPLRMEAPSLRGNLLGVSAEQMLAVYLPPSYGLGSQRYPVIYFLPNFNMPVWRYTSGSLQGFRWPESLDRLVASKAMREVIVVIPNAQHFMGSGFYRNSPVTGRWEDYVVRDVVHEVDRQFRTISRPRARGLAGHGVGGTGALEVGLKHPDVFGHVFALSPAVVNEEGLRQFADAADQQARRLDEDQVWQGIQVGGDPAKLALQLWMQRRLQGQDRSALFDGLRLSYVAAARPEVARGFPYLEFPRLNWPHEDREAVWGEVFGDWAKKLKAYLDGKDRLASITLEYGKDDEHEWIRHGTEHLATLMASVGIARRVVQSNGRHDSTLGQRWGAVLLPMLSEALADVAE